MRWLTIPPFREWHVQNGEGGAKRELTERRSFDCASSIVVIFFSRIALRMNNSEDLAPESLRTTSHDLVPPTSKPRCHIPHSAISSYLRIPASAFIPRLVVRSATRTASSQAISSLTRILCILKCTRDTLFELWPFVRSGIQYAFLSWITWRHRSYLTLVRFGKAWFIKAWWWMISM